MDLSGCNAATTCSDVGWRWYNGKTRLLPVLTVVSSPQEAAMAHDPMF
jgi:hypothetical protein